MSVLRPPDAVVLMYHRVHPSPRDPYWLSVEPGHFAEQLDVLRDATDVVVPLDELFSSEDRPRIAVTFDDGYRDNLDVAAPALAEAGIPATVFIATRILDDPSPMWWDVLEHLILDAELERPIVLDVRREVDLRFEIDGEDSRDRALQVLARRLRPLGHPQRNAVLESIASQLGTSPEPCACHRLLDRDGVAELGDRPGIQLGAHTVSHAQLSSLPAAEQRSELRRSREDLESLGHRVTTAAYPFGGHVDWDRSSIRAARDEGFTLAVTATEGGVSARTSRHRVPRYAVRNWPGDVFAAHLRAWMAGTRPAR